MTFEDMTSFAPVSQRNCFFRKSRILRNLLTIALLLLAKLLLVLSRTIGFYRILLVSIEMHRVGAESYFVIPHFYFLIPGEDALMI